ncbi:hypothetical protein [Streptomyces sp. NPDC093795]|uniref:hypothetical protein n=1 Tax=Streptomyces sp. NPDC093795 TaxID=3366051 RepID=UPI003825D2DB
MTAPANTALDAGAAGAASWRGNASFRAYWAGEAAALAGSSLHGVALPVVAVLELDATPGQVSWPAAASTAPAFVLALPAGAAGERCSKKQIMVGTDLDQSVAHEGGTSCPLNSTPLRADAVPPWSSVSSPKAS